jgi:glycosyltransferase involved in cell wall biosynthesis
VKIYISRQAVTGPWGGGNRWLRAFLAACYAEGWRIACSVADADVAFIAAVKQGSPVEPGAVQVATDAQKRGIPCIFRVNDCDARKGTDDVDRDVRLAAGRCAHIVYVSRWLAAYAAAHGVASRSSSIIINGVDRTVFDPTLYQHRSLSDSRLRIVTHHWSDNRLKGALWYEALDSLSSDGTIVLTYVGRHACKFSDRTIVVPPCDGHLLATTLACNDVYVSGSTYDPGPNHILEAAALGMPMIVAANGGGCVEFAAPAPAVHDADELVSVLRHGGAARSTILVQSWDDCAAQYVQLVKDVMQYAAG